MTLRTAWTGTELAAFERPDVSSWSDPQKGTIVEESCQIARKMIDTDAKLVFICIRFAVPCLERASLATSHQPIRSRIRRTGLGP